MLAVVTKLKRLAPYALIALLLPGGLLLALLLLLHRRPKRGPILAGFGGITFFPRSRFRTAAGLRTKPDVNVVLHHIERING
jgi:hypothetical protein